MFLSSRKAFLLILAVAALAACDSATLPSVTSGEGGAATTAVTSPPETAPPETAAPETSAPETSAPETSPPETSAPETSPPETSGETATPDEGGIDPETLLIVLGLVVALIILGWLMGRTRKEEPPIESARPTWKDNLREGYAGARWLHDAMTDEIAIWRGNSLYQPEMVAAGSAMEDRWKQLDERMSGTADLLYRAEAEAPDQMTAQQIGGLVARLNSVRAAIDARAEARLSAASSEGDPMAAERERVASASLSDARKTLNDALTSLGGLL